MAMEPQVAQTSQGTQGGEHPLSTLFKILQQITSLSIDYDVLYTYGLEHQKLTLWENSMVVDTREYEKRVAWATRRLNYWMGVGKKDSKFLGDRDLATRFFDDYYNIEFLKTCLTNDHTRITALKWNESRTLVKSYYEPPVNMVAMSTEAMVKSHQRHEEKKDISMNRDDFW
jgi:hypothetical protein